MTLLEKIKSDTFMLWVAMWTVIFLSPNTYYVYYSFSVLAHPWREIASAGFALIVASSVLIYTLRKNYRVAKYFSAFEMMISAYYYVNTIGWDWGLLPALGFTLILPISIYYCSKEIEKSIGIVKENVESVLYLKRIIDQLTISQIEVLKDNEKLKCQVLHSLRVIDACIEEKSDAEDKYKKLYDITFPDRAIKKEFKISTPAIDPVKEEEKLIDLQQPVEPTPVGQLIEEMEQAEEKPVAPIRRKPYEKVRKSE